MFFFSMPFYSEEGKRRHFLFSLFEMHGCRSVGRLSSFGLTSIMVYVFRSNAVSLRIRKKETFPFSLFEMHGAGSMVYSAFVVFWPYKHKGLCFSIQRRFIANK